MKKHLRMDYAGENQGLEKIQNEVQSWSPDLKLSDFTLDNSGKYDVISFKAEGTKEQFSLLQKGYDGRETDLEDFFEVVEV